MFNAIRRTYKHRCTILLIALCAIPISSKAAEYENQQSSPVHNAFSDMTQDTYDGYPLFPQGLDGGPFHYSAQGIDVKGNYSGWTNTITYTVTQNGQTVTRRAMPSAHGYRMIHGVNYNDNLFVVSYRR